ncbi:MAG: hypothetical protein HUJ26_02290 [Planctomycetaceae bacterium]|nr:hypothetical protein [Planctomycetaceae bacterium]
MNLSIDGDKKRMLSERRSENCTGTIYTDENHISPYFSGMGSFESSTNAEALHLQGKSRRKEFLKRCRETSRKLWLVDSDSVTLIADMNIWMFSSELMTHE